MNMLSDDDCDDCVPDYVRRSLFGSHKPDPIPFSTLFFSTLPFILIFVLVATLASKKLYPRLATYDSTSEGGDVLSKRAPPPSPHPSKPGSWPWPRQLRGASFSPAQSLMSFDKLSSLTFSVTIALSTVLAALIFCEITNLSDPIGRGTALDATISSLLPLLILITPALEMYVLINGAQSKFGHGERAGYLAWILGSVCYAAWLFGFWWIGKSLVVPGVKGPASKSFREACLERIAVIGIASMAALAGFAAISSLWQAFGVKVRRVTETDLTRKEAGIAATNDLILTKESRRRALERKIGEAPQESFVTRMVGSMRGTSDAQELAAVRLEISGLETMRLSLANSLRLLRSRRQAQQSNATPVGRICLSASYLFSLYCFYRIAATSAAMLRRWWAPATTFANTDPINNVLALFAKHVHPSLDRAAWSRQISFLLSGVMLLASFNAVLQTVLLLGRFMPSRFLHAFHQNLALLVAQISATYVISSALLLRSNLPKEMGGMIEGALGTGVLDTVFMERWFEGWFLVTCLITAAGIWFGRKVIGIADWEEDLAADDLQGIEDGKRC